MENEIQEPQNSVQLDTVILPKTLKQQLQWCEYVINAYPGFMSLIANLVLQHKVNIEEVSVGQQLADFLTELVIVDKKAMQKLVLSRVECNSSMANHPSVQVVRTCSQGTGTDFVGILGILNGFIDRDGSSPNGPRIQGIFDDTTGELERFVYKEIN
jgi:hypothetical protein